MQEAWSGERERQLRKLFDDPRALSAGEIAMVIGGSRNSVIGKLHRLGLRRERSQPTVKTVRRNNLTKLMWNGEPPLLAGRKPPRAAKPVQIAITPLRIGILSAAFFNCKWVLDERGPDGLALVCGLPVHDRSFCQHHFKIAYPGYAAVRRERETAAA